MFNTMFSPTNIIRFIKSNTDIKKIVMNFINSQECKEFIELDLGKDYEDLKKKLLDCYMSAKNSEVGNKREAVEEEQKKLCMYKDLANKLITDHRFIVLFSELF